MIFQVVKQTFQRFARDKCGNYAIIISYFALMCSIPLVALFTFVSTRILGNSEIAFRSLNIFNDEFFAQLDPAFFERLQYLSQNISNLGWFGLAGSFIAASFLFSNLINAINCIFRANTQKSFFYSRLMEYILLFVIGIILLISLSITAVWTAIHRIIQESPFVANNINPDAVSLANNFFLQYLIPFVLTFLFFFSPSINLFQRSRSIPKPQSLPPLSVLSSGKSLRGCSLFMWLTFQRSESCFRDSCKEPSHRSSSSFSG